MSQLSQNQAEQGRIDDQLIVRDLNLQPYVPIWEAMKAYAVSKNTGKDELWVVQHQPVYTRGIRCKEFPDVAGKAYTAG